MPVDSVVSERISRPLPGDNILHSRGRLALPADELTAVARAVRCNILTMNANAGTGHTGGSLSGADYLTAIVFHEALIDPATPNWPERDIWLVSNAHVSPLIYSVMAERGYFPRRELLGFRQTGGTLQGHPSKKDTPGIEISAGSIGQGLSVATGVALAAKMDRSERRVYCCMGDGEQQEGQIWEAAMAAAHYGLDNLVGVIDFNRMQIDGAVADVMNVEPLADKYRAFGWRVVEVDGHDMQALLNVFAFIRDERSRPEGDNRPTLILARTVMGKGWPVIEDDYRWHGKPPSIEQADEALRALGTTYEEWRQRLET